MQIVRTIVWVVLLVALLTFSFFNWNPVEVQIWPNLILETKIPALVIVSCLLGLVPMWLIHRGAQWRYRRRLAALETAARSHAATAAAAEPLPPREESPPAPAPEQPTGQTPKPKDEILG